MNEPPKLTQQQVDQVRMRVNTTRLVEAVKRNVKRPPVKHLRFHRPRTDGFYELRDGNPPSDSERNTWERGLKLELDIGEIPESVARAVRHLIKQRRENTENHADWNYDKIKDLVLEVEKNKARLWLPGER